ncbi:X2-like carbohydrate binding domain-containing protein [Desulfosporosinus sp. I2]|uniref:X2-like carbohydrate binding domain-containing protein n=1 Tax=Desulfosporosinus sp. I2 TaxID=1617025 RepID=UPI0006971070|nr:X2-like carbohydrate binding domain-containing protein [Desulfosporosinus sp. I2]
MVIGSHGQGVYSAANTMTLLLKSGQSVGAKTFFAASNNSYSVSELKAAMDTAFSSGWSPVGTEKNLIQDRTLAGDSGNQGTGSYDSDKIAGDPVEGAKFWPLSVSEYNQLPTSARAFGDTDGWWLRSPGYIDSAEAMVKDSTLYEIGTDVSSSSPSRGLRPAFQIYTGTFLFTSPAAGGKTGAAGSTLSSVTPLSGSSVIKLTLKNSNPAVLNLGVGDKTPRTVSAGETFSVAYTGAKTGTGKYVSCVLVGADGSVQYYGKLKDLTGGSASADGVADITFPVDLPAGAYTLRLFNEQINGDNVTDFASPPEDISLTVDALPAVAALTPAKGAADVATSGQIVITFSDPMNTSAGVGAVSLSGGGETKALSGGAWSNGNKTYTVGYTGLNNDTEYTVTISGFKDQANNVMRSSGDHTFTTGSWTSSIPLTAILGFGGKQWAVIGNNGQGVYSAANTMTLLLQDGQSFGGTLRFDSSASQYCSYSDSTLKIAMDTAFNGLPAAREQDLVQGRTLEGGNVYYIDPTYDPDKIYGAQVDDAKLWPLSDYEYQQLPSSLRLFSGTDGWWLRSPGTANIRGMFVDSTGNVNPFDAPGSATTAYHALRPAFRMNLQSVFFTSPATGGKPGAASDILSAFSQPTGPMKFTMKDTDTARLNLSVSDKSPKTVRPGAALAVGFTGAVTGTGKYISCVIQGANNTIKYYGKLVDLTGGSVESDGTASITLPADMPEGTYTLRLFNEEIKGNNETDFAGTSEDISLTVDADAPLDKILVSVTAPTAITGVANGTAKTASALGLPSMVTLVTNDGNVSGNVTWNVASSSYDPSITTAQTFIVSGTVTLTSGVVNPNNVSLSIGISVTVAPLAFVPVTGINDVPAAATAGVDLPLIGSVAPANATNQTIVWSVQNAGTTGATVSENTLSTTVAGTVSVRATITNGLTESTDYSLDFNITVNPSPVSDATISPNTGSFDKFAPADVQTSVTWGSATGISDVKAAGTTLGASNYNVSGNTLTIKKEYLVTQPTGGLLLTVEFNAGPAATLTIAVSDTTPPTISPVSRNYDLNAPADMTTTITWNSASTVTGVVCGADTLAADTDFTLVGNELTIKDSCLSGLTHTTGAALDFDITFDTGAAATFTVEVVDGYVPSSNADLSSLAVNGTPVNGFDPDDTEYDVVLPFGASGATITATTVDPNAGCTVTPAPSLPGSATVTVTAEDGSTTKVYTINFTIGGAPTVLVTGIAVTGTGGVSSVQVGSTLQMLADVTPVSATDTSVTWSIEAGSGATIDASGLLTATAVGTVTVRATANDSSGVYGEKVITLTPASPTGTAPAITITTLPGGRVGTAYSRSLTADGDTPITWTIEGGSLPNGLTLSSGGVISGTPTAASSFSFTVKATNAVGSATKALIITINAAPTGGGGGGGGNRTPPTSVTPPTQTYNVDVKAGDGSETTLPVTVDGDSGCASIDLGSEKLTLGGTVITVPSIPGVDTYSVGIPVSDLSTTDVQGKLTLNTDTGSVTVPTNMLTGVAGISGSKAEITIGQGDKSTLPGHVKAAIGDKPLISLSLYVEGKQTDWSNPNAPVTVSIPYTPTAKELANPEGIVIWYIDGAGRAVSVANGRYDPAAGTVTFFTSHFSNYAVAYVHKTFSDLGGAEWARKAIEVLASKGITSETGDDTFSPNVNISKADFMVMLVNTLGLTADFTDNFDDVQPDAYYYIAVGTAKKLGIAADSGNRFNPTESISRQDMMMLATRALEKYQGLKASDNCRVLDQFSDKGDIAEYAANSLATLVDAELIESSGDKLNPRSYTTRAEVAGFLYNIYNKYPQAPVIVASGLSRLAGQTKIDTALSVAGATYPDKITNVVLATADSYPDALAGSVLAYQLKAPILLVGSSEADQAKVMNYLKAKLEPEGTVNILGGTAVVSSGMEDKIQNSGFSRIIRVAGETRYDTAVAIAKELNV